MINLPQGFKVGAAEAVDSRLTLSKTEMLTIKDSLMPTVYFLYRSHLMSLKG